MRQSKEELEALELFNEARAAHSLAHKRYMDFRKRLKVLPKDKATAGDYREFLRLKDVYSEACKARNKAEIEFLATKSSIPFGKIPADERILELGVLEIFDATLESESPAKLIPTGTDMAKHEQMIRKGRLKYGGPGDPDWEIDRDIVLKQLGLPLRDRAQLDYTDSEDPTDQEKGESE